MKCPIDNNELQEIAEKGFSYNQCPKCKGIWMRMRALNTLFEQIDPDAEVSLPRADDIIHRKQRVDTNKVDKCPNDAMPLYERKLGKVTLDFCHYCDSVWLDPGEFEELKGELERHEISNTLGRSVVHMLAHFMHFHWSEKDEHESEEDEDDGDEDEEAQEG